MLMKCLAVGLGGFAGSVARYLISAIKLQKNGSFPVNTLLVNVIGAVLIGLIISCADKGCLSEEKLLFLKVGLCGGLTTFSTFSAETFALFENGSWLTGLAYIAASLTLCIIGVYAGLHLGAA